MGGAAAGMVVGLGPLAADTPGWRDMTLRSVRQLDRPRPTSGVAAVRAAAGGSDADAALQPG